MAGFKENLPFILNFNMFLYIKEYLWRYIIIIMFNTWKKKLKMMNLKKNIDFLFFLISFFNTVIN